MVGEVVVESTHLLGTVSILPSRTWPGASCLRVGRRMAPFSPRPLGLRGEQSPPCRERRRAGQPSLPPSPLCAMRIRFSPLACRFVNPGSSSLRSRRVEMGLVAFRASSRKVCLPTAQAGACLAEASCCSKLRRWKKGCRLFFSQLFLCWLIFLPTESSPRIFPAGTFVILS